MRSNESEWAVAYTKLFKMGRRTLFKIEFSENMIFKPVFTAKTAHFLKHVSS